MTILFINEAVVDGVNLPVVVYRERDIYIYMLPPPLKDPPFWLFQKTGSTILAVTEDCEANEAFMKCTVNECDAC